MGDAIQNTDPWKEIVQFILLRSQLIRKGYIKKIKYLLQLIGNKFLHNSKIQKGAVLYIVGEVYCTDSQDYDFHFPPLKALKMDSCLPPKNVIEWGWPNK